MTNFKLFLLLFSDQDFNRSHHNFELESDHRLRPQTEVSFVEHHQQSHSSRKHLP